MSIKTSGVSCGFLSYTVAIYRLKAWSEQGKELLAMLPVLKTYLGHGSFNEKAYCLRMTADVFPDIFMRLEGMFGDIIPYMGGDLYEADGFLHLPDAVPLRFPARAEECEPQYHPVL